MNAESVFASCFWVDGRCNNVAMISDVRDTPTLELDVPAADAASAVPTFLDSFSGPVQLVVDGERDADWLRPLAGKRDITWVNASRVLMLNLGRAGYNSFGAGYERQSLYNAAMYEVRALRKAWRALQDSRLPSAVDVQHGTPRPSFYADEGLLREMKRLHPGERKSYNLGLLIIDIENFQSVTDEHGFRLANHLDDLLSRLTDGLESSYCHGWLAPSRFYMAFRRMTEQDVVELAKLVPERAAAFLRKRGVPDLQLTAHLDLAEGGSEGPKGLSAPTLVDICLGRRRPTLLR